MDSFLTWFLKLEYEQVHFDHNNTNKVLISTSTILNWCMGVLVR